MLKTENIEILNSLPEKFETVEWSERFCLECYGSKINIRTDYGNLKSELLKYIPVIKQLDGFDELSNTVSLITGQGKNTNGLYFNNEPAMLFDRFEEDSIEFAADKILMIMAAVSLPSKIYLHAGAVVWNGFGILIPGTSFSGKTTLVKEFIEAGADYYSDDCIVLDDRGNMLPFPRDLAIRTDNGRVFKNAANFGAKNGIGKEKIKLILFADYVKNSVWKARKLTGGESVLKLMDNFYYRSSVGHAPSEIIKILTNLTNQTLVYGGERGDASQIIRWVARNFFNE